MGSSIFIEAVCPDTRRLMKICDLRHSLGLSCEIVFNNNKTACFLVKYSDFY